MLDKGVPVVVSFYYRKKEGFNMKKVTTGQQLYLFSMKDDGKVTSKEVFVIDHNKSSIYIGYHKEDEKSRYLKIKTSGSFPEMMKSNPLEFYYVSDDKDFGKRWEKNVYDRRMHKASILKSFNLLFYTKHTVEDYKKVDDFLKEVVQGSTNG